MLYILVGQLGVFVFVFIFAVVFVIVFADFGDFADCGTGLSGGWASGVGTRPSAVKRCKPKDLFLKNFNKKNISEKKYFRKKTFQKKHCH